MEEEDIPAFRYCKWTCDRIHHIKLRGLIYASVWEDLVYLAGFLNYGDNREIFENGLNSQEERFQKINEQLEKQGLKI